MALKDYIVFTRIHTAALSVPLTVLGVLLAGVPVMSWQTLEFAVLGLLFHAIGFAQNNLADYRYDIQDPAKQHHPLVQGRINFRKANWIVNFGMIGLFFYGAMISNFNPWSLFFLGLMIISGNVYNYASKDTVWSFIPITLCFSSLPMIAYFTYANELSSLMLLVYIYITLQLVFQIAVEGCMKELQQENECNLMRSLGYRVEDGVLKSGIYGYLFGALIKAAGVWIALAIVLYSGSLRLLSLAVIIGFITFVHTDWLISAKPWTGDVKLWDRDNAVQNSARIEIFSYILLIVALQGVLGWSLAAAFILLPVAWFAFFNKIFWNTYLIPRV